MENLRYSLTVDFEDDEDIRAFLNFIEFHSKRLKCPPKDVMIRLSKEWEKQMQTPVVDLSGQNAVKPTKKRTTRQPYKDDEDTGNAT